MRWKKHFEAEALLTEARQGIRESLGRLLQTYANYTKLVATTQVGARLEVRVSPSDVVQETFLQAHRTFDQFRGRTEAEFLAWLQRILASQLTHLYEKHILAEKRDARREVSLDEVGAKLERSTARLASVLGDRFGQSKLRIAGSCRACVVDVEGSHNGEGDCAASPGDVAGLGNANRGG